MIITFKRTGDWDHKILHDSTCTKQVCMKEVVNKKKTGSEYCFLWNTELLVLYFCCLQGQLLHLTYFYKVKERE